MLQRELDRELLAEELAAHAEPGGEVVAKEVLERVRTEIPGRGRERRRAVLGKARLLELDAERVAERGWQVVRVGEGRAEDQPRAVFDPQLAHAAEEVAVLVRGAQVHVPLGHALGLVAGHALQAAAHHADAQAQALEPRRAHADHQIGDVRRALVVVGLDRDRREHAEVVDRALGVAQLAGAVGRARLEPRHVEHRGARQLAVAFDARLTEPDERSGLHAVVHGCRARHAVDLDLRADLRPRVRGFAEQLDNARFVGLVRGLVEAPADRRSPRPRAAPDRARERACRRRPARSG